MLQFKHCQKKLFRKYASSQLTGKFITGLEPGVLRVCLAGGSAMLPQILLQVPALGFIKGVKEQRVLLNARLYVQTGLESARLTDYQWTNQT